MGVTVAVAGASGYAGGELLRLLAGHPDLDVVAAAAHSHVGQRIVDVHPHLASYGETVLQESTADVLGQAELIFLALPHGASAPIVAQLGPHLKIVDLGADFRLVDPIDWQRYYAGPHAGTWTYGLPELPGQRALIAASDRVANTGCYAVSVTLALAPLIRAGVVHGDDVVVVASSGTSGAGRSAKLGLLGTEVMNDLTAYKVGAHQHVAEILQATGASTLSMTPILAPMPRGILSTITARPVAADITVEEVRLSLHAAYDNEAFVHVLQGDLQPRTAAMLGSNSAQLQVALDVSSSRVIITSAIDNLGKGAAGQAIQNANIMLGLPEAAGLSVNGTAP